MNALLLGSGFSLHQEQMTRHIIGTLKKALGNDICVIDTYKTSKMSNVCDEFDMEIVKINTHYDPEMKYKQIYEDLVEQFKNLDIDNLIVYRMPIFLSFKHGNVDQARSLFRNIKQDGGERIKFVQSDKFNINVLMIKAACKMARSVCQYIIDVQEARLDEIANLGSKYRMYSFIKYGDLSFAPMYEYSLLLDRYDREEKEYDFYFECSCLSKDRREYLEKVEEFENDQRMYCKVHTSGKGMTRQSEYYEMMRSSKFTMIIKPYVEDHFSMIRLLESISNGCVPLIEDSCNYDLLKGSFRDLYDLIVECDLVCKFDKQSIKEKVKQLDEERQNILEKFRSSRTIMNFMDEDKLRRFYERIFDK